MLRQDYLENPTNQQRHALLLNALTRVKRADDYQNILDLLKTPPDIYTYASVGSLKNIRIGIIGCGLAGLSAAYELRKLGATITLFEAENHRIGGRVYTCYFDPSKQYFGEFGALRIPVSHETSWHYINLFNLDTQSLASPDSNNFIYVHHTRIRRDPTGKNITNKLYPLYNLTPLENTMPWPNLRSYAFDTMLNSLSPSIRTQILKIIPEYNPEYAAIVKMSNREVFEKLGLSQGAISLISAVEPLTGSLLDNSHDGLMNSAYSVDFSNVYKIRGGMAQLPAAFYQSLTHINPPAYQLPSDLVGKISVKLGHIVNSISKSLHTNKVILRYSNPIGSEIRQSFDYVICAVPFSTLRDIEVNPLFSNQKMQAIRELNYCDAQKTLFFCKERFWQEDADYGRINGGISFTDLPIESILYPLDGLSSHEPGVLTASYNLGQDSARLSNQNNFRRFNLIKQNIEKVHGLPPRYLDSLISNHKTVHWNTQQWSRGAFAMGNPGQKINFAYAMAQPEYNQRVFFAGEHVSVKPGWIQGALYTGKSVANQIAQKVVNNKTK